MSGKKKAIFFNKAVFIILSLIIIIFLPMPAGCMKADQSQLVRQLEEMDEKINTLSF